MKIIGVAGSPRKDKSSKFLLEQCFEQLRETGKELGVDIETEIIDLAGKEISGCVACDKCKKGLQCSIQDDFQPCLDQLSDPALAGMVISTPVYMGSMTAQTKAFVDRTVSFRRNGFLFRDKLGGVIAVGGSRNGGQELTVQAVHAGMMIHDMIIVGDGGHFGGAAWGNFPEGYEKDQEGVNTARNLGKRMAEVMVRLYQ